MSKPHSHKSKRPNRIKTLRDEPIIMPHSPAHLEANSLPSENSLWPVLILIIGSFAAAFCFWEFAPEWLRTMLKNVLARIWQSNGE